MLTVLITGAGTPLGAGVLSSLSAQDWVKRVIAVDEGPIAVSVPKSQFLQASLKTADLPELFSGIDCVVHLAAGNGADELTRCLRAATEAGVSHLVVPSSAAVFGAWPSNPVPLSEDAPLRPNPGFAYAVALAEQERRIVEWRRSHADMRIAVLRFALMVGGGLEQAFTEVLGGVEVDRQLHGNRPVQFLHIDDAVSAVVLSVEKQLDGPFNVSPKSFVGNATARALAGAVPRPPLPVRLGYLVNEVRWRRRYRAGFAAALPYFVHPWVMSSDRLLAEGWKPSYTSEEAVAVGAEAGWWGRLNPSQRRAVILAGSGGSFLLANLTMTVGILFARRRHRR